MMQSCTTRRRWRRVLWMLAVCAIVCAGTAQAAKRQPDRAPVSREAGGEASLVLPDLGQVNFLGVNARSLLMGGLGVCALGLAFGLLNFTRPERVPVHKAVLRGSQVV